MHSHKWVSEPGAIYKFCARKDCKKRKKIVSVVRNRKSLQRKAEDLWRAIAYARDGRECAIKKSYPDLRLNHSTQLQVDHFFPRADKNLFFDPSNATVVCAACNYLKSNGSRQSIQIQMALQAIVSRREGEKKFYEMCDINNTRPANLEWGREYYLEKVIKDLTDYLENINGIKQ